MIEALPIWIEVLFIATVLATIALFYYTNSKSKILTIAIILWSSAHGILAYKGFYQHTYSTPPRFALILLPASLFIIYGLLPKQQIWILKTRDRKISTLLHSVRIPVEIVLYALLMNKMIPALMTFEGRNFDILIGISAPIIALLINKGKIGKKGLLVWNIVGLIFVLFILVNGILSAELPFQQFGFEQPNKAITFFPFVLLPATVVPIVIWTHLSDIVKLKKELNAY